MCCICYLRLYYTSRKTFCKPCAVFLQGWYFFWGYCLPPLILLPIFPRQKARARNCPSAGKTVMARAEYGMPRYHWLVWQAALRAGTELPCAWSEGGCLICGRRGSPRSASARNCPSAGKTVAGTRCQPSDVSASHSSRDWMGMPRLRAFLSLLEFSVGSMATSKESEEVTESANTIPRFSANAT